MENPQAPDDTAAELDPGATEAGPARARWDACVRMIGAVLIAGITTVAVGAFGINGMSMLSEEADVVYAEGTVADALRKLQVDWRAADPHRPREHRGSGPARAALSQEKAAVAADPRRGCRGGADLAVVADAAAAFGEFAGATQEYLTLVEAPGDRHRRAGACRRAARVAAGPAEPGGASRPSPPGRPVSSGPGRDAADDRQMNALEVTIVEAITPTAAAWPRRSPPPTRKTPTSPPARSPIAMQPRLVLSLVGGLLVARSVRRRCSGCATSSPRWPRVTSRCAGAVGGGGAGRHGGVLDTTLDARQRAPWSTTCRRLAGASTQLNAAADGMGRTPVPRRAGRRRRHLGGRGLERRHRGTGSSQMESAIREIAHNATEAAGLPVRPWPSRRTPGPSASWVTPRGDRHGHQAHQRHRRADQPAGAQRHDRGSAGGEAGKGFAVVASEVKELAQETARATEDIAQRVETIQTDTAGAVRRSVRSARSSARSTTSRRPSPRRSRSRRHHQRDEPQRGRGRGGTQGIAAAITGLAAGTQETNRQVEEAQRAAAELDRMSGELQEAIGRFSVLRGPAPERTTAPIEDRRRRAASGG